MKKYSVAILGCGSRGADFASLMAPAEDKYEIVAFCDTNKEQIEKIQKLCGVKDAKISLDPDEFLKEKYADVIIIATPDRDHVPQAVKAMNLGYDILIEKPLSDSREDLDLLLKTQKETGRTVVVCHEFRYGPGFRKCAELIKEGAIGKLYSIDASERVWYLHWAQAYVRGIGASLENGHPAILAKCSHDLDMIQAIAGSECDTVSSLGELGFFVPENAPEGAAYRCLDCKHQDSCAFSAKRMYIDMWHEQGRPAFKWPFNKVTLTNPHTEESIRKGLREGEYGVCVFKCKVEKVDHQFVQMHFKNGVKASLKMVYAGQAGRRISFYGNYGEIVYDERYDSIEIYRFGKEKETLSIKELMTQEEIHGNHGGGDAVIAEELYDILSGNKECSTTLRESIESHLMGIAADESRKMGGKIVKVHQ